MSKLQTLIIFTALQLCQPYEFQGLLSDNLKEAPQIATHDDFGVNVDLVVKPKGDVSLDLLALKGQPIIAKAWLEKKISPRKYEAKVYHVSLGKPQGLGAKTGTIKAKKINDKLPESCSP